MRPPLTRTNDRVIAGVCGGLAVHLGLSTKVVRLIMAGLALAGGAGILLYGWLWALVPTTEDWIRKAAATADPANPRSIAQNFIPPQALPPPPARTTRFNVGLREILIGAGLLILAGALLAQQFGAHISWGALLPAGIIIVGAVIAWTQLDASRRTGLIDRAGARGFGGIARLGIGLVLVIAGVLATISGAVPWDYLWSALLASLAVLAGVALVLTPWGIRFWRDLEAERAGRVRQTERAEIAAHLHDSVLQTLALIQNRAGSEADVIRLARAQERELREWLYRDRNKSLDNLVERIKAVAAEVEDELGVPVDVVVVGEAEDGGRHDPLVQATREAILNAAKHAGGPVSVYMECTTEAVEVFVRDRGPGFDPEAISADRLGVRESVIGRMRRHGGTAVIKSSASGTEVQLRMPQESNAAGNRENHERSGN